CSVSRLAWRWARSRAPGSRTRSERRASRPERSIATPPGWAVVRSTTLASRDGQIRALAPPNPMSSPLSAVTAAGTGAGVVGGSVTGATLTTTGPAERDEHPDADGDPGSGHRERRVAPHLHDDTGQGAPATTGETHGDVTHPWAGGRWASG